METTDMGFGDKKPKRKRLKMKCGVDACPDFSDKGSSSGKPKMSFSFSSKKTKSTPTPEATPARLHMNVRNLGDEPGDVKPSLDSSKSSFNKAQSEQGAVSEKTYTKAKFKLKKRGM